MESFTTCFWPKYPPPEEVMLADVAMQSLTLRMLLGGSLCAVCACERSSRRISEDV